MSKLSDAPQLGKLSRLRLAVYLRRSKGESGTTADQLEEITPFLDQLESKRTAFKFNRNVGGRDITKQDRGVKLEGDFDIWNEGEGQSGYSVASRPVFMALLEALKEDRYDGVIAVSMDRFARNYGALSRYAYELFDLERQPQPKIFYGVIENIGLGMNEEDEVLISALMNFGGLAKRIDTRKGEKKRKGTNVDKGYLLGTKPEFIGKTYRGKTSPGVPYRIGWESIQAGKNASQIAKSVGKTTYRQDRGINEGDRGWTRTWKPKLTNFNELGVLDDWLDNVEAVNEYIQSLGPYPKVNFKSEEVSNLLRSTAGYFAYPAGVNLGGTNDFIVFPNPLLIGIDRLASTKNALDLDDFEVKRTTLTDEEKAALNVVQTQPRSAAK